MGERSNLLLPVARWNGLVIVDLADETLVYDLERHKAHCLNQTAALVWKHCDGRTTLGGSMRLLEAQSKTSVDEDVVWLALNQLEKANLLTEGLSQPAEKKAVSRREVLRRLGWAAAVSLPLVTSIAAPTAAQADTPRPAPSLPCERSADCASGLCGGDGKCVGSGGLSGASGQDTTGNQGTAGTDAGGDPPTDDGETFRGQRKQPIAH